MTREEIVKSLEKWKKDVDPTGRWRNYTIVKFEDNNGEFEQVSILLDRNSYSFNFSINEHKNVIFENFENPVFSGFVTIAKFRENLFKL